MSHKNYLVRKRCRIDAICGPVNLPYGTLVVCEDGFISTKDGKMLCYAESQNARDYFSHNDDGMGAIRGHLVQSILDALGMPSPTQSAYEKRNQLWAKVWEDPICLKHKDPNHADFFLWDISFYEAEIEELRHINKLVGGKSNV